MNIKIEKKEEKEEKNEKTQEIQRKNYISNISLRQKRISEILNRQSSIFSFSNIGSEKAMIRLSRRIKKLTMIKKDKEDISDQINLDQVEMKVNALIKLEPFFSEFDNIMNKKGRDILTELAYDYDTEILENKKIIFKYGDEINKFYLIKEGEVELFFPFTEEMNMNIDEFYIYILRLRRYNEIEMLNNVLLLNECKFLKEIDGKFDIDKYIYKLYRTYIKIKYDPTYLNKEETKHKKNKNSDNNNNINESLINENNDLYKIKNIDLEDVFENRELKESILRIKDELIETIKWIMPEKICEVVEEKKKSKKKKIMNINENMINIYKNLNPNNVNGKDYIERILPKKIVNDELITQKIIVMKYLKIDVLTKGQHFGDFNYDSFTLFSHSYLNIIRHSLLNINLHKYHNFRNMTAISSSINYSKLNLFSFNKTTFTKYFSKYIEKINYDKKKYLLNHRLFEKTNNKNMLKTYSICFKEQKVKEGEYIIKENEKLIESNIFTSFIIKGEFQLYCSKTIHQIDEIIKILGKEDSLKDTYNKAAKEILNTPQYDLLVKNPINIKLNYLTENDIIGLTECLNEDRYFINVQSIKGESLIYKVDSRIIKLLADSDKTINDIQKEIIYDKYNRICECLLNKRKMFFESLLNINKINMEIDTGFKIVKKKYKIFPQIRTYKPTLLRSRNITNSLIISKLSTSNVMSPISPKKKVDYNNKISAKSSGKDLFQILSGDSHKYTLRDRSIFRSIEFRKKFKEKMSRKKKKNINIETRNKLIEIDKKSETKIIHKNENFQKTHKLAFPLLNKNLLNIFKNKCEFVLPYKLHKSRNSNSTSEINPLLYDNFNRSFNTTKYFNLNNDSSRKNKDNKEYVIKFNIEE